MEYYQIQKNCLGVITVSVLSQGCSYNPTGHPVLSQAQSGIHPQSHWSPCAFTGIHLHSNGDPCAFTGFSSLKTPSQTPFEPILISVSQSVLQSVCLLHLFVLCILSPTDFVTYPHGPCPLTRS